MAGVMAVVMLMLVMSVLQKTYADLKHKQEMEQGGAAQQKAYCGMCSMQSNLRLSSRVQIVISFNISDGRITLKDNVFEKGSACITPLATQAFKSIDTKISVFLQENHRLNLCKVRTTHLYLILRLCTFLYNCMMTTSRYQQQEQEAKAFNPHLDQAQSKRIVVAGFGVYAH